MSATPTLESLHSQWVAAFGAQDLDRYRALYTEDVLLFGGVDVDFADGGRTDAYRMTWVLDRRVGNWRMAQHHGSPRRGAGG